MSCYTGRVEGFQMPEGDEYTLNAENEKQAKEKATARFKKAFHYDKFDYVETTIVTNGKKKNGGRNEY
jgi:hypothetical protein